MAGSGVMIDISEKGVELLNKMSDDIGQFVDSIAAYSDSFVGALDDYPALGPHKKELLEVIEEILLAVKDTGSSANSVGEKLRELANDYEEFIENNRFRSRGK